MFGAPPSRDATGAREPSLAQGGQKVSFWWLVGLYFLEVCGEMCLSPVGLSTVTKLAPAKLVGLMMGAWFLFSAFGEMIAGCAAFVAP